MFTSNQQRSLPRPQQAAARHMHRDQKTRQP
uniref:Uncharacterized protein n=1 Tax=Anguilla anguilla TaxID=7936 RepID=A0A0E9T4V9_ANGAN